MSPLVPLLALATLAGPPRVFVTVDRTFLPDAPGSVVRVELENTGALDVRLYRLRDPERFLTSGEEDLTPMPAPPPGEPRGPSAGTLFSQSVAGMRSGLHAAVTPVLTDAAREALRLLAPGTLVRPVHELPLLRDEPLIRRSTLPCGGSERHRYCDVDLGPLPSGVYLVEGVAGGAAGYALALVSRLALASRRTPAQLVLYATDARTGEPRGGVQLAVAGAGQPVLRGATSASGTLALKPAPRPLRALAHVGSDWAVLDVPAPSPRPHGSRVWLSANRGEARPGESVRLMGAERPPPPSPRDLAVSLEDGRGTVVAQALAHQDAQGLFTGELDVPPEAALGLGHLVADVEGRPVTGELWIRNPAAPDLSADAMLSLSRTSADAEVRARDGSGAPLSGHIEWRLLRSSLEPGASDEGESGPELVEEGQQVLGADGRAQVRVALGDGPDARYRFEAAAVDAWGRRLACEATAVRLRGPAHVKLAPERRIFAPGESARISIAATDASGRPAALALQVRATVSRIGPGGEALNAPMPAQLLTLPQNGTGELVLSNLQPGYYELEARVGKDRVGEAVFFVSARGGDIPFTPDAMTLVPDRPLYAPGETARLLLFTPFEAGSALVTFETGDVVRHEVVQVRNSSALLSAKLPASGGLTVAAVAVRNGQSFGTARMLRLAPPAAPGQLLLDLENSPRPGTLALVVRARDAQGRPLAGVSPILSWRDADAQPSLAPPLAAFVDPAPVGEGRTDLSLEFQSAGHSTGAEKRALAPLSPAAFTPQKGTGQGAPRPLHSTAGGIERLPATDRTGSARIVLDPGDARALALDLVAALPPADAKGPPYLAQLHAERVLAGPTAVPHLPPLVRANDRALAQLTLVPHGSAGSASVGGRTIAVPAEGPVEATLSIDAQHPAWRVEAGGRLLLQGRVPVVSGEEWVTAAAGEAPSGLVRLSGEGEEGTLRVRVVSGPIGLLRLLSEGRKATPLRTGFEQVHPAGAPAPETDGRLAALALAVASGELHPEPRTLASAAAAVIERLEPSGELPAFPGGPYDARRTALGLWLLRRAQALGAGIPADWLDRVRARLEADPVAASAQGALLRLALDRALPVLDAEKADALSTEQLAALALLAVAHRDDWAAELATRLERTAGVAGVQACWSAEGCDPRAPATEASVTATAWAALGLAAARPHSPKLGGAMRYLLATRDQAVWGRGLSGTLLPLAMAAGRSALPDRAATLRLSAGGATSEVRLAQGTSAILFGAGGSAQLRVSGGPVFYEVARARAEPATAAGELRVERRYYRVRRSGDHVEREPLSGKIPRGAEVLVELTVSGMPAGALLQLEDRFPGGLMPIEQAGKSDPVTDLEDRGGAVVFAGDRVQLTLVTGASSATVGYLARARLAGHYVAPPVRAWAGELAGRSEQAEVDVEGGP